MSFTFAEDDVRDLSKDQKVAIMEALVAAVMADLKAPTSETTWFYDEVAAIDWGMTEEEVKSELKIVLERVKRLENTEALLALIQSNAAQLSEQSLREKVLRAMGSIMFADQEMLVPELEILVTYANAFDISLERFKEIKAVIKAG